LHIQIRKGYQVDKLTSMNVFVRVAKLESFSHAAKDLGMSKAMVTKHVMQLENKLGTRLFNRTTRNLSLTEVGSSYLARCQQVLSDVDEMEEAITHLQSEPRGVLKISAPPVIGVTHIAPALAAFLKLYPELSVDLTLKSGQIDLIDEGLDIAIYLGTIEDTSLIARKLGSSSSVVCGAPSYFAKYGIPQHPEELVHHNCLVNWAVSPRDMWHFKSADGEQKVIKVTGQMQANAADPIKAAAVNGLGLIMLPEYIVGKHIAQGILQVVLEDYTNPLLEIHAVYPHRKYLSAKVSVFLDFLQNWLQHKARVA
jgi:DNA-binding transcriptional LysR family regulator